MHVLHMRRVFACSRVEGASFSYLTLSGVAAATYRLEHISFRTMPPKVRALLSLMSHVISGMDSWLP